MAGYVSACVGADVCDVNHSTRLCAGYRKAADSTCGAGGQLASADVTKSVAEIKVSTLLPAEKANAEAALKEPKSIGRKSRLTRA